MAHPKSVLLRKRRRELQTVPADKSRERLVFLSSIGIGRKAVCEVTGLTDHGVRKIKNGQTRYVQRETERLILSVPMDAHSDRALIDAEPTWDLIEKLTTQQDMGFTRSEIARRLGAKRPEGYATLQLGRDG